jgi:hypothetical protein
MHSPRTSQRDLFVSILLQTGSWGCSQHCHSLPLSIWCIRALDFSIFSWNGSLWHLQHSYRAGIHHPPPSSIWVWLCAWLLSQTLPSGPTFSRPFHGMPPYDAHNILTGHTLSSTSIKSLSLTLCMVAKSDTCIGAHIFYTFPQNGSLWCLQDSYGTSTSITCLTDFVHGCRVKNFHQGSCFLHLSMEWLLMMLATFLPGLHCRPLPSRVWVWLCVVAESDTCIRALIFSIFSQNAFLCCSQHYYRVYIVIYFPQVSESDLVHGLMLHSAHDFDFPTWQPLKHCWHHHDKGASAPTAVMNSANEAFTVSCPPVLTATSNLVLSRVSSYCSM